MLNIWYGEPGLKTLTDPDLWFKNFGKPFLGTDFSKKLISTIDKCEYISNEVVNSKYLGVVVSDKISSGSKTIMCMMYGDMKLINAAYLGDNMIPYLRYVADRREIFLLSSIPVGIYSVEFMPDYTGEVRILNTGEIVRSDEEMYEAFESIADYTYRVHDILERSILDDWRKKLSIKDS